MDALQQATKLQPEKFQQWILGVKNGDCNSENCLSSFLYKRYRYHFSGQGYRQEDIEDALQEALISLILSLRQNRLRCDEAIRGYFLKSVKYLIWKFQKNRLRFVPIEEGELSGVSEISFYREVEAEQKLKTVVSAIDKLSQVRDREIIKKRFFEEQSVEELCCELCLKKSHYYRVLHRARNRLTELVA